uniref:ATP synthase complex subunit 8 n=1 Tax=Cryptopsaras couesii TaxID=412659 RepID=D3KS28_CRYCE|nr:ATP synthase F0 subunit 8 [Cryptopsaras couesii]BAI77265.1 ATPase subunit 8 [Cryptopsaras couesii]
MPQLSPAPWLGIFMFSWFCLLLGKIPTIMGHTYPNGVDPELKSTPSESKWTWPWRRTTSTNS